jgi:hypothetical protein
MTYFMKYVVTVLLFLTALANAQSLLTEIQTTTIPLGPNITQVGIEKGEGENWKPLFFSADTSGNIHIPDFYKYRIAVYSSAGDLVRAIPVQEGISPRMNYFSLAAGLGYITYDGNTLFYINANGSLKWKHPFGFGVIPTRVFVSSAGIFAAFPSQPGSKQGTFVFTYSSPQILGSLGYTAGSKTVPLVAVQSGKPFALQLGDMHLLPDYGASSFKGPGQATLLAVSADFRSLWSVRNGRNETFSLYSPTGRLLKIGLIVFPEGDEGTGFWTYVDADLGVYKNYYQNDEMLIVKYRLSD